MKPVGEFIDTTAHVLVIDDDAANRTTDGLIGVQVHVGGPMKIEYRNFRLKNL